MSSRQKVKGSQWERDATNILTNLVENSVWKKMPTSGAMGTTLHEPLLMGDITGTIKGFPLKLLVECKVGYNSSTDREIKQFTLKKEWLDKVNGEADSANSLPFIFGKFDNVHSGVKNFIVLDTKVFAELLNYISDITRELELLYDKEADLSRDHKTNS